MREDFTLKEVYKQGFAWKYLILKPFFGFAISSFRVEYNL
jgi:hypothetical protein